MFEHRVSSAAAAGEQSQGCCSSQCPTVVVVLRNPTPQGFASFDGDSPQKVIYRWKFSVCLLLRSGFSMCVCADLQMDDPDER